VPGEETNLDILRQTFLRNEPFLLRVHVVAVHNQETLFVAPHWHETHDELIRIIKGRMEATIGSNTRIYVPEDGEIRFPKHVVHSLRSFVGEEMIFEERTEPMVSVYICMLRCLIHGELLGRAERVILPQSPGQRGGIDEPVCSNANILSLRRVPVVSRTISMVGKDGELLIPK